MPWGVWPARLPESKGCSAICGSGLDTRAGNISNWAGCGRFCFLSGCLPGCLLFIARSSNRSTRIGDQDFRSLINFYVLSAILVVVFFAFGLLFSRGSHLTVADYWRWFVVHIWVESIFEFFGVAVISVLLVAMGLASAAGALRVAYFTAALVFLGGILGTAHHYFWYGGPSLWLAIGSVFSSMEPVPLFGLVVRGLMEYRSIREKGGEFFLQMAHVFPGCQFFLELPRSRSFRISHQPPDGQLFRARDLSYGEPRAWSALRRVRHAVHRAAAVFLARHGGSQILVRSSSENLILGLQRRTAYHDAVHAFPDRNRPGLDKLQGRTLDGPGRELLREAVRFHRLGQFRIVPDTIIIVLGVLPLVYFLFKTYPRLKKQIP